MPRTQCRIKKLDQVVKNTLPDHNRKRNDPPPRPLQWGHDPHDVEIRPKKKRATYGDGRWTLAGAGRAFNGPLSGASGPEATAPAATAPAAPSADSERILAGATPVLGDLISMRIGITCCALATSAPNFWNRPIKKKTNVP